MTSYQYAANNPIFFIDVNGDSINVSDIQKKDGQTLDAITSDLTEQTGLTLSVTPGGQLTYATDENGNPIIATDADGNQIGSESARDLLTGAISSEKQAYAVLSAGKGSKVSGAGSPLSRLILIKLNLSLLAHRRI